jgi:hypothetical protein
MQQRAACGGALRAAFAELYRTKELASTLPSRDPAACRGGSERGTARRGGRKGRKKDLVGAVGWTKRVLV